MKLVLIEWEDCHSSRGWLTFEEIEEHDAPLYIRSVGWLLKEGKKHIIIVANISGEKNEGVLECGKGHFVIPTAMITKMTVLRK